MRGATKSSPNSTWQTWRLLLLVLAVLGLWIMAAATGTNRRFGIESIREVVETAGLWGIVAFIVLFSVGQLLRVPGPVFVAVAVAVYGGMVGFFVALLGALVSVSVSFAIVRVIGGQPLAQVQRPIIRRLLNKLDRRPVVTVALLRLIFQTAPPVNYALAMTALRPRDHLIGSALGLPLPLTAMALFMDWLLHRAG